MSDGGGQVEHAAVRRHTRGLLLLWVGVAVPCGTAPTVIALLVGRGDGPGPAAHGA